MSATHVECRRRTNIGPGICFNRKQGLVMAIATFILTVGCAEITANGHLARHEVPTTEHSYPVLGISYPLHYRYSNHLPVGTHSSMLPYLYFNLPPARWLGLAFSPPNVPIEILRIFTCLVSGVMPHVSRCTSSKICSGNRQPLHLHAFYSYMAARKLIRDDATAKQQKTDRHKFPVYALRFSACLCPIREIVFYMKFHEQEDDFLMPSQMVPSIPSFLSQIE